MGIKKYLRVSKNVMQTLSAYRLEFLMYLISIPIYIIISFLLWKNIFEFGNYQTIVGYSFKQMIAYFAFQITLGLIITTNVDFRIGSDVKHGEIAIPFLRPYKYILSQVAIDWGGKIFFVLIIDIPLAIICALFFFMIPKDFIYLILSLIALFVGFILNFMFSFCVGLVSFWTQEYRGIGKLKMGLVEVLSGRFMPLSFFPAPILAVLNILPFSYLGFAPANIFLGKMSYLESLGAIAIMLIWIGIFYVIYRIIWKFAKKQITGVGI